MTDEARRVLERVAAGELAPEEALALLDQQTGATAATAGGAVEQDTVRRVVVDADLGAVTIVGDETVVDAVAVGGHVLRRVGSDVRIEAPHGRGIIGDGRLVPRLGRRHALRVRMRPDLALRVRLGTGSVHAEGLGGHVEVEVDLGTATLERLVAPFAVRVASGSVSVGAMLDEGSSSVTCDLGTVTVRLHPASDVRVTASTDAGRITLPGSAGRPSVVFGTRAEAVLGSGTAELEVRAAAGSITVKDES